ncbi:uncharacterized protein RB166_007965 [Leptodactylus fuscus]
MWTIGPLLLIFLLQGGSCQDKEKTFCTEQRGTIIVEEGGSVTIPCNFTYPRQKYRPVEVRVSWRRGFEDRCGNGDFIYNYTNGWTHKNYTGRISLVGTSIEEGTAAITISDLRKTDRAIVCYELSVEQTDVVPAMIGEDITIPCVTHYNKSPSQIIEVTWTMGSNDVCADNNERIETWTEGNKSQVTERWSVGRFPWDLSLIINKVTSEDIKRYCCKVRTKLRYGKEVSSIHGTEVIAIAEPRGPMYEVVQPEVTSPDKDNSTTLRCSFTHQSDTDPLWVGVFWRVGSPRGIYAYHPLPELVHPYYRGRTELRGLADLHIKEVRDQDNTTYYCLVMLKFCIGNKKTNSNIRYGTGTKLVRVIVGLVSNKYSGHRQIINRSQNPNLMNDSFPDSFSQDLTVIIYVVAKNLIVLVLVTLALLYLKKRSLQTEEEH